MSRVPDDVRLHILSLLLSNNKGVRLSSLQNDYRKIIGQRLEWSKYGYKTLWDMVRDMPETIKVEQSNNSTTLFGIPEKNTYIPGGLKKAVRRSPSANGKMSEVTCNIDMSDPEIKKYAEQMVPNMKGMYCICIPRTDQLTREEIAKIFGQFGHIEETSLTPKNVFLRYRGQKEALAAFITHKDEYDIRIPYEKNDPRHVIKGGAGDDKKKRPEGGKVDVYVGNLTKDTNESDIRDLMRNHPVEGVRLLNNDDGKKYGFITVRDEDAAVVIREEFHNQMWAGHCQSNKGLIVQLAFASDANRPKRKDAVQAKAALKDLNYESDDDSPPGLEDDDPPGLEPSAFMERLHIGDDLEDLNYYGGAGDGPPGLENLESLDNPDDDLEPPGLDEEYEWDAPPGLEGLVGGGASVNQHGAQARGRGRGYQGNHYDPNYHKRFSDNAGPNDPTLRPQFRPPMRGRGGYRSRGQPYSQGYYQPRGVPPPHPALPQSFPPPPQGVFYPQFGPPSPAMAFPPGQQFFGQGLYPTPHPGAQPGHPAGPYQVQPGPYMPGMPHMQQPQQQPQRGGFRPHGPPPPPQGFPGGLYQNQFQVRPVA